MYWHVLGTKTKYHVNNRLISCLADPLLGSLQIHRLVRKNLKNYDRIIHYRSRRFHLYDLRAD